MNLKIKLTYFGLVLLLLVGACKKVPNAYQTEAEAKTILNVSYGTDAKQKMDVYLPANRSTNTGIIILVHGGASFQGDKSDYALQAEYLISKGYAVLNVNYRLVDGTGLLTSNIQHLESTIKIKDQVSDMANIVDYAISHAKDWVVNSSRVVMIGHSAGGNISLLYAYDARNTGKVKAVANLAGPVDFVFTDVPNWQLYPTALFELGYRYTGFDATEANEKHFKDISPMYVSNVNRKIPTLNVMPQDNDVMGLPKMDVVTYNKFTERLKDIQVPNEYFYVSGADHNFTQPKKWEIVLTKAVSFFSNLTIN